MTGVLLLGEKSDGGSIRWKRSRSPAPGRAAGGHPGPRRDGTTIDGIAATAPGGEPGDGPQKRRILHDDVLPQLHAAMLELSSSQPDAAHTLESLADVHRQVADLLHSLPRATAPEVGRLGFSGRCARC